MVLSDKHCSGHQSTVQAPSPHHQHHHYHPPVPASTNGGTGLKAAEGFICGTAMVGSSSLPLSGHSLHTVPTNCLKIRLRPYLARTRPGHGLYTMPKNYLEILENQALSPCVSDMTCLEMPKNQAASLLRPGYVSDMAYTLCPKTSQKCPKIRLHPYLGQDAS
ncbi:Hypothetical predicted protein [Olea europaea subsp. europaea]|uniref:Uncharacterized protein n=1 Tax=Olea europaea subsp. europaea TaxID=158383 RepID=A0A8S0TUP0_OLEEU|nr:Hypothetical predicted protein [Olea europaea subsp. europaea]